MGRYTNVFGVSNDSLLNRSQTYKPCDFENSQQSHGSENTDAERRVGIIESPDDFKQTASNYLQ